MIYQFNATYVSSFVFTSPEPYTFAQVYTSGWGYRSMVSYTVDGVPQTSSPFDGYYYSSGSHTRLPNPGTTWLGNAWVNGTATGTMTGTVSGILGQPLTGTMTSTGTLHDGGTYNYFGPVTLYPDGHLEFYYEGTRANAAGQPLGTTVNGVATMYPGTYFKQTSGGSYREVSDAPYSVLVVKNTAPAVGGSPYLTGTQSQGFAAGAAFKAGFHFENYKTRLTPYELPAGAGAGLVYGDQYTYDGTLSSVVNEGVIGAPVNGVQSGAMTATFSGTNAQGQSFSAVLGGPVLYYSGSQVLYGELYGGELLGDGRRVNKYGQWIQTFDPNAYPFTQRYLGSISTEARPLGFTSTALSSVGWGHRDSVSPTYYSGSMAGTISGGSPDSFNEAGNVQTYIMLAGVTDAATGAATGTAFPMGFVDTGSSMPHFGRMFSNAYTPGSISLDVSGNSTITLNNINIMEPAGTQTPITFSSTLTTRPGQYFNIYAQGNMVVDPENGTYDSRLVSGGPLTVNRVTGPVGNFSPYFSYIIRTRGEIPGDFSAFESGDHAFFIRGVLSDDGGGSMSGAMDIKSINLSGWSMKRYAGSANLYPGGELVGDIIGINRAVFADGSSGRAQQTGTWIMAATNVGTYNFSQTFNGAIYVQNSGEFANFTGTGWGQRTGVYAGYFSADINGYASLLTNSLINPINYYTFTSTMSGSVSGRLGHTLLGSMTWTGTLSTGESFNYFGPVSITADGQLKFYYEGTVLQGETLMANGGGRLLQTPGTYFTQTTTAPASFAQTSYAPYNDSITYTTAEATVNRSSGPGAGTYRGSFINLHTTETVGLWGNPAGNGQPSQSNGTLALTTEGVMSPKGSIWTGAQTTTVSVTGGGTVVTGGPVFYYPSTGVTVAQNMGSSLGEQYQGLWVQVPQGSSLTTFTQTYFATGSMTPNPADPLQGTLSLGGWGFRNGVVPGYYYGTSSAAITKWWGEGLAPWDAEIAQLAMAGYVGPADGSGNHSGSVWATGDATDGVRLNAWPTGGSASINLSGAATFNFNVHFHTGGDEGSGQFSLSSTPGTFFYQKTDTVTETTSSTSPFRVQNLSASATGSGTFPGMSNFEATLSGTNTAEVDNTFPSGTQVSTGHTYYSRGVITSANVGALDLTRVSNVGDLARLRAQITLNATTNELQGRLIGLNRVNRVSAVQRFDYLQRLAAPLAGASTSGQATNPLLLRLKR